MRSNIPSGTVTFLFTDIEGSTRLLEALRDEYETLMSDHQRIFRAALPRWNGHEIGTEGDSFFIAFPRAIDAIQFTIETQHELTEHGWPGGVQVKVRMGLHTGEPLISPDGAIELAAANGGENKPGYIGMDIHRAARIAAAGHGGQVLLSQTTRDLIYQDLPDGVALRYLGLYTLKDIRFPQQIYQLVIEGLPGEFPALQTLAVHPEPPLLDNSYYPSPEAGDSTAELEAYRSLIKRLRAQGRQTLDRAGLAILLSAPAELKFAHDDLVWLMRSALQDELELEAWCKRAESEDVATQALDTLLGEYPKPQIRLAIIRALCGIPSDEATIILLRVTAEEDSTEVRIQAALEAARRGRLAEVQQILASAASQQNDPSAVTTLVAVIDEFGSLPPEIKGYPKVTVMLALYQRRWLLGREDVVRQSLRASFGGALAVAVVCMMLPLLERWIYPADFERNLQFISAPAWYLSSALAGLVWGGIQGLATGLTVGVFDVLTSGRANQIWRFVLAGLGGWIFTLLMILFSSAGLLSPHHSAAIYIPVFILYGFLQGGALSWVLPRPGTYMPRKQITRKVIQASLFIALVAIPAIYLVYQETSLARLPIDWMYAVLMPTGLALATNRRQF